MAKEKTTQETNLDLYNKFRAVPQEAQKEFNNGKFKGTDINPMWRIKKLTEEFGPCGIGWYYRVINREMVSAKDVTSAFISIELYVKVNGEWSMPIYGEGGNTFEFKNGAVSDEAYKMALTDALSNASKQLGLGADIWFAKDKTKYTKNEQESKTSNVQSQPQPQQAQQAQDLFEKQKECAFSFLKGSENGRNHYLGVLNKGSLDDVTDGEWAKIYQDLVRLKYIQAIAA